MTYQNKTNKHSLLLYALSIFTVFHLLSKINTEFYISSYTNLESTIVKENIFLSDLKSNKNLGWFKLGHTENYEKGADFSFVCFQYLLAPTVLENEIFTDKIICYYTSPIQLINFCKKNRKYRIINHNLFNYFALLERIN